jgi:uncharacterized Zn finger protein
VRNGSVVDLQIDPGEVHALVCGSEIYKVTVKVTPISAARWASICQDCAGAIDSLVELLQGRFSKGVMERICRQGTGLFPSPPEIVLSCSCPDWAAVCKHVAAVFYGIGARLDRQPELLFKLHAVDEKDLIANAGRNLPLATKAPAPERTLGSENLSEIFGLEIGQNIDTEVEFSVKAAKPVPEKLPATRKGKAARTAKNKKSRAASAARSN